MWSSDRSEDDVVTAGKEDLLRRDGIGSCQVDWLSRDKDFMAGGNLG